MNLNFTTTQEQEDAIKDAAQVHNATQGTDLTGKQWAETVLLANTIQSLVPDFAERKKLRLRARYESASPQVQAQIDALLP